jgi:hypothetical protein
MPESPRSNHQRFNELHRTAAQNLAHSCRAPAPAANLAVSCRGDTYRQQGLALHHEAQGGGLRDHLLVVRELTCAGLLPPRRDPMSDPIQLDTCDFPEGFPQLTG